VGSKGRKIQKDFIYSANKIRKDSFKPKVRTHEVRKDFNTYSLNRGRAFLYFRQGDISSFNGDAIVSCTNQTLTPGVGPKGVDGAVQRAAGPGLAAYCKKVKYIRPNVKCPVTETVLSPGFMLPSKYIIHTVGPVYRDPQVSEEMLYDTYYNCCHAFEYHGVKRVALPAISCGVYGFPEIDCARIALDVLDSYKFFNVKEVYFYLFNKHIADKFDWTAQQMLEIPSALVIVNPDNFQNIGEQRSALPAKSRSNNGKAKAAMMDYTMNQFIGGRGF